MAAPEFSAAPQTSPFSKKVPFIVVGVIVLQTLYVAIRRWFRDSESILGLPPPTEECCANRPSDEGEVCSRSDYFAFCCVAFLCFILMCPVAFYQWHILRRHSMPSQGTKEGRVFGHWWETDYVGIITVAYQIWDIYASLTIPEKREFIMVAHHFFVLLASYGGLKHQLLHRYGLYFLGLVEISSIPLVFIDMNKCFDAPEGSEWRKFLETYVGPSFVVTFLIYRVFLWWPEGISMYLDTYWAISSGQLDKIRPGARWVPIAISSCNFMLALMQLYWLQELTRRVKETYFA